MSGGFSGVAPDAATFKNSVFYYMITKTFLAFSCTMISYIFLDDRQSLPQSKIVEEESLSLGFSTQMKLLLTNKIYLMFVYGPLFSVCLISATDNHLGRLLLPFGISNVSDREESPNYIYRARPPF